MSLEKIQEFFSNLRDRSLTVCENCLDTQIGKHRQRSDLGYCFYRPDETFYASETGILKLSWGSYSSDELAMLVVVNAILDEAKVCGLDVQWAGSMNDRIILKNLDVAYFLQQCIS